MVISVVGVCLVVDEERHSIRVALGSVAPTVVRAPEAEAFIGAAMLEAGGWDDPTKSPSAAAVAEFAERVAAAARPIDDVRGSAAYRAHACRILAGRALRWALADRKKHPWW
jgi:CO/xanthine dehydrogenase FAD-binding subunit